MQGCPCGPCFAPGLRGLSAAGPVAEPALISAFPDGSGTRLSDCAVQVSADVFCLEHIAMGVSAVSIKH